MLKRAKDTCEGSSRHQRPLGPLRPLRPLPAFPITLNLSAAVARSSHSQPLWNVWFWKVVRFQTLQLQFETFFWNFVELSFFQAEVRPSSASPLCADPPPPPEVSVGRRGGTHAPALNFPPLPR
uniref:Uncharacterized protein n=1 Tax=Knipowitschia caucasica TaxID=637954 RepID=A0AAV2KHA8_KNICA